MKTQKIEDSLANEFVITTKDDFRELELCLSNRKEMKSDYVNRRNQTYKNLSRRLSKRS